MASVKRNSVSLSHAISSVTHSATSNDNHDPAASSSLSSSSASASSQLDSLRLQHASERAEWEEQTAALKLNIQHLHRRAQDMEKQNATLMAHLSDLEEERQRMAERRERQLKKRMAKQKSEGGTATGPTPSPALDDDDVDSDDIESAREKWAAQRSSMEGELSSLRAQLNESKQQLSEREATITKLEQQLNEERNNVSRIVSKIGEKEEELMKLREELHHRTHAFNSLRSQVGLNPASSPPNHGPSSVSASPPPASPSVLRSPSERMRNFFSGKKHQLPQRQQHDDSSPSITSSPSPKPPLPPHTPERASRSQKAASADVPPPATPPAASQPADNVPSSESSSSSTSASSTTDASASASVSASATSPTPDSPPSPPSPPEWSPDLPLDVQVAALKHELSSMCSMRDALVASVARKDASLRQVREDGERIMTKLTEKEMMIMQLREGVSGMEGLKREMKKKETIIAKLQQQLNEKVAAASSASSNSAASSSDSASAAELRAATAAIAVVQGDYDSLKETLENTKDMLFLAETQLLDKSKIINEQNEALNELRAAAAAHDNTVATLMNAKETAEKELNEHIDYLEQRCLREVAEWEGKYERDIQELRKEKDALHQQLSAAMTAAESARAAESTLKSELSTLTAAHDTLQSAHTALQSSFDSMRHKLDDLESARQVDARRRNRLVVELKEALRQEIIRRKDTLAKLKTAEDDIVALRVMNAHQIASNMPLPDEGQTSGQTKGSSGHSGSGGSQHAQHGANGSTSPPDSSNQPSSTSNNTPPAQQHAKGVEQEVTVALAQKLAQVQNEKHSLQSAFNRLQEHCELLENDVTQKKEIIRNMIRRIETGSLTMRDEDGLNQTPGQMSIGLSSEARQELFEKMELILQETTLQNSQYKNNLKSMGAEMTKLMEELDTLKEELSISKEELALATQSADDASTLLQQNDAIMRRMEECMREVCNEFERSYPKEWKQAWKALKDEERDILSQIRDGKRVSIPQSQTTDLSTASPTVAASASAFTSTTSSHPPSSDPDDAAQPDSSNDQ